MKRYYKRGFTLIELLIVIATIGILTTVVLANLSGARPRTRDATRVSDLKNIQLSMEFYRDAVGGYPASLTDATYTPDFMDPVPTDPQGGSYQYAQNGTGYVLGATFEQATNIPDDDIDGTVAGINCSGSVYCLTN